MPVLDSWTNRVKRYEEVIWWSVGLGTILGLLLVADRTPVIARDWRENYREGALAADYLTHSAIANPAYVFFLLRPLAFLPLSAGYAVLMAISLACLRAAAHLSSFNKWFIFPSFTALWILIYGQLDALVALGVALGWWAIRRQRPYWQGAATVLLCLKPHVAGPLAVIYLFWQKDRRAFLVSGAVLLLSLIAFGFWPLDWLRRILFESNAANESLRFVSEVNEWNNIGAFPYGLLLWPLVLLPFPRAQKIPAVISATLLSSPYAGAYSLLSVMAVPLPLAIYPILSLPLVSQLGYDLIVIAPLALVVYPAVTHVWSRRPLLQSAGPRGFRR